MATLPIEGSAIAAFPSFPPMPAVARILARFERDQLAGFVAVALDLIDTLDGDPDFEDATDLEDDHALSPQALGYDTGAGCEVADTGENAWVEWDKMRGAQKTGHNLTAGQEDDEDDDLDHALDEGEPNFVAVKGEGAGCSISDPDYGIDDQYQDEPDQDMEREQMLDDVPMLPVVTLDTNIFTDQRQPLGISNLQSSFRVGGEGVRSADSGAMHRSNGESWPRTPGGPV